MADINLDKLLEHFDKRFDTIQNSVNAIRQDFNTFEAGRLTDLTAKVAVLEEQNKKEENSLLKTLGFEILKAVVIAVVAGVMFLVIK
jgi:Skp family chaperone for outer membrane proteins